MAMHLYPFDKSSSVPCEIADGIYALTNGIAVVPLVLGSQKALMIDTGFGDINVLENARAVTDLPIILVNTHGHMDHIGLNDLFETTYASEKEFEKIRRKSDHIIPVEEGYCFDLGDRTLEVINTPGHTPGSISLLDRENRCIFTGDMVSSETLFLQFPYSDLKDYIASMDKLISLSPYIEYIICYHGPTTILGIEQVYKTRELAELILNNKIEPKEPVRLETEDGIFEVHIYEYNGASIFF